MNSQDEELQKKIERWQEFNPDAEDDALAYQYVFKALRVKPTHQLPEDFADKIVKAIEGKKSRAFAKVPDHTSLVAIPVCAIILIVAVTATGYDFNWSSIKLFSYFDVNWGFLKSISPYQGVFIFGIVFIILLNVVDKTLIRRKDII